MRNLLLLTCLVCSACATKKAAEIPPVADARADGSFLFLTTAGAQTATNESLAHAMRTMCDPACDRVYVDIGDDPPADVLERVVAAARGLEPAPRVYLIPMTKKPIELDTTEGECAVTVAVRDDGAAVWRQGDLLAPDPACEVWNTAICRGEDRNYDWPRLRSEIGVLDQVCVAFEVGSAAQIVAIHETLRQPIIRLVRPDTGDDGRLPVAELAAQVKAAGRDMQWCLDGEVADSEQVPMNLTLRVAVHTDGTVTRVEVLDGVRTTANFEACVSAVAEKFRFDPRSSPQLGSVKLSFEPGGDGPKIEE